MIRKRILVTMHGKVMFDIYDTSTDLWNFTAGAYVEKHDYAIAQLQESTYNEDTAESTPWETIAELRGMQVR